jgi:hypothetical protein
VTVTRSEIATPSTLRAILVRAINDNQGNSGMDMIWVPLPIRGK